MGKQSLKCKEEQIILKTEKALTQLLIVKQFFGRSSLAE
jgi:hypothetical protein